VQSECLEQTGPPVWKKNLGGGRFKKARGELRMLARGARRKFVGQAGGLGKSLREVLTKGNPIPNNLSGQTRMPAEELVKKKDEVAGKVWPSALIGGKFSGKMKKELRKVRCPASQHIQRGTDSADGRGRKWFVRGKTKGTGELRDMGF